MNALKRLFFLLMLSLVAPAAGATASGSCPDLLNQQARRLQDDQAVNLCTYAGQVALVVNTASQCGYTSQYDGLEALYKRYRQAGFVVLGFPSNDFGSQEPGNNRQIAEFCKNTFDIQFPMFSKTAVTGPNAHPLFRSLSTQSGQSPRWNFHKYLIGRDGKVIAAFPSQTDPLSTPVTQAIQTALTAKP